MRPPTVAARSPLPPVRTTAPLAMSPSTPPLLDASTPASASTEGTLTPLNPRLVRAMRAASLVTLAGVVGLCWLFGASWLVGYVCWLLGNDQCAERIARPVRFLLQNQPSAGLAAIILGGLVVLLFFVPVSDFLHNLESGPWNLRRKRASRREQRGRRSHEGP